MCYFSESKSFFLLPVILSLAGCDNMTGISCDGKKEIASIKQQITLEREKQKQSYFSRHFILDGTFDIKDITENNRDKEQKILTCSASLIFSPDIEYGKSQSTAIEYTVKKTNETPAVSLIDVGRNATIIESRPTEGQIKYKAEMEKKNKSQEKFRKEEEERLKAEREKERKEEEQRLAKEMALNKKTESELAEAALLPDDKFTPLRNEDLLYIFIAQSGRQVSDNEKLELFSERWNNTKDAFVKRDIEKEELEKININIDKFENIKDIWFYFGKKDSENIINVNPDFELNPEYNFETQSFPVSGPYCKDDRDEQRRIRTISYHRGITLQSDKILNSCTFKVPESEARSLSEIFNSNASVSISTTVYGRIIGFDPKGNIIKIAILRQNAEIITKKPGEEAVTISTVFK